MKHDTMTLRQFQRRFRTEQACIRLLFRLRWPDGYRCPRCGHLRCSFHTARRLYQCSKCKYQVSVTAGTIFHKTRTPLIHWFWIIFIMTRQKSGVSMLSLQGMLGMKCYKTVWNMAHKIRKAMADRDAGYQLSGLVETFQAHLRPAKSTAKSPNSGRGSSIVVSVEDLGDSPGFARIRLVHETAAEQSEPANSGALASRAEKHPPATPTHSEGGVEDCYEELNPILISDRKPRRIGWARILMANLTGNIRGVHHGVSEKYLHRYLAEFFYRFNRRAWSSQLLNRTLVACVFSAPITCAELKL